MLNIVAFHQYDGEWPDSERLTRKGTRTEALEDFDGWSSAVRSLLGMCNEELSVVGTTVLVADCADAKWAIFDLENEVPSLAQGRVALSGDAAHGTSPHHGAGAGFCVEDAAVLATLLADPATTKATIPAALAAYDACRRDRGRWLVKSSRHLGRMYDWQAPMGDDMQLIRQDLESRYGVLYGQSVDEMCNEATQKLRSLLGSKTYC